MTAHILSSMFVLARDNDSEGWINLLIPVVVAIFWAINALAGATKSKKKKIDAGKSAPRKPSPRPAIGRGDSSPAEPAQPLRAGQQTAVITDKKPQPPRPKPPRRPMSRPHQKLSAPFAPRRPRPTVKPVASELQPLIETPSQTPSLVDLPAMELGDVSAAPLKKLTVGTSAAESDSSTSKYLTSLGAEYDDPERLRMAILHSVILGKPKAMENPDE